MRSGSVNLDGNRGRLYFLIKLPQSGGSTFANEWVRKGDELAFINPYAGDQLFGDVIAIPDHIVQNVYPVTRDEVLKVSLPGPRRPRVVIGGDDFRIGVHGQEYLRTSEGLVFACMDAACRALLARGFDVLVDETSTTEQTLLRYFLIDYNAEPILIDTPEAVCLERALASGKDYLVEPIRLMARQKEELLKDWPAALDRVRAKIAMRYPNDIVHADAAKGEQP